MGYFSSVECDQRTEDARFRNVFICSPLLGSNRCGATCAIVVVVLTAPSTDVVGYFQVLHKAILVPPWEGREWPH